MSDSILALVPIYGLPLLALTTALSCLGLPFPASMVMLLMGSFVAADEFSLLPVFLSALLAALAGDQLGFFVGRRGGASVIDRLTRAPKRRRTLEKARAFIDRNGRIGIFLTRWLLSPLGPYINVIAGAAGYPWRHFTLFGALGEVVWVSLYVGLGYVFSDNVTAVAEIAGNATGFLAAGAVTRLARGDVDATKTHGEWHRRLTRHWRASGVTAATFIRVTLRWHESARTISRHSR